MEDDFFFLAASVFAEVNGYPLSFVSASLSLSAKTLGEVACKKQQTAQVI